MLSAGAAVKRSAQCIPLLCRLRVERIARTYSSAPHVQSGRRVQCVSPAQTAWMAAGRPLHSSASCCRQMTTNTQPKGTGAKRKFFVDPPAFGSGNHIVDASGFFTKPQHAEINKQLAQLAKLMHAEGAVVVVTEPNVDETVFPMIARTWGNKRQQQLGLPALPFFVVFVQLPEQTVRVAANPVAHMLPRAFKPMRAERAEEVGPTVRMMLKRMLGFANNAVNAPTLRLFLDARLGLSTVATSSSSSSPSSSSSSTSDTTPSPAAAVAATTTTATTTTAPPQTPPAVVSPPAPAPGDDGQTESFTAVKEEEEEMAAAAPPPPAETPVPPIEQPSSIPHLVPHAEVAATAAVDTATEATPAAMTEQATPAATLVTEEATPTHVPLSTPAPAAPVPAVEETTPAAPQPTETPQTPDAAINLPPPPAAATAETAPAAATAETAPAAEEQAAPAESSSSSSAAEYSSLELSYDRDRKPVIVVLKKSSDQQYQQQQQQEGPRTGSDAYDWTAWRALLKTSVVATVAGGIIYMIYRGMYERRCPMCQSTFMTLVPQEEQDAYLTPCEMSEKKLGVFELDVYKCSKCGTVDTAARATKLLDEWDVRPCKKCKCFTLASQSKEDAGTPGYSRVHRKCMHCGEEIKAVVPDRDLVGTGVLLSEPPKNSKP